MGDNEPTTPPDVLERNKQIYLRFLKEYWSEGNADTARELLADDYGHRDSEVETEGIGPEEAIKRNRMYRTALPDLTFEPQLLLAEGDLVACYYKGSATHRGELFGIAPTGIHFEFKGVDILKIVDGKIVEGWDVPDLHGILQQIQPDRS